MAYWQKSLGDVDGLAIKANLNKILPSLRLTILSISINDLAVKAEELLELVSLIYSHIICVREMLHKSYYRTTCMHEYMTIESFVDSPHCYLMIAICNDIAAAQIIEQSHNIMVVSIRDRE
ncbi:hypothetical protein PAEPH01_2877 [Pancytospora epiphaga]|nr:hypothetical protein PAEPH01_2877 [Pancytospora epiphaga]